MSSVAFSTDGRSICAGDHVGNVYAWDVATGALRWRAPGSVPWHYLFNSDAKGESAHGLGNVSVAASPDGRIVASGGNDGHVKIWEASTGALVADVEMAAAGRPWVPWPGTDPHRVWTYPYEHAPQDPRSWFCVYSLAFSPDGRWLACGMGGSNDVLDAVYAIDTRTWAPRSIADYPRGTLMRPNPVNPSEKWETFGGVKVLDFSPTGRWLAASADEGIRIYEIPPPAENDEACRWRLGEVVGYDYYKDMPSDDYTSYIHRARFMYDDTLAIVHEGGIVEGIKLANGVQVGEELFVIDTHTSEHSPVFFESIAASPDGRWLAVGGDTGFVVVDIGRLV